MEPVAHTRNEWDDALARVMAFLAKLQLSDLEHRVRSATRIIDKARFEIVPGESPVEKSMEILFEEMDIWFSGVLPVPGSRGAASGVVSLRALGASERWPEAFLDGEPPEEIRKAVAGLSLATGPDLSVSSMVPREMDFGAMEVVAHETWHQFAWGPIVRAAIIWTVIFFALLYAYEHFFAS